MKRLFVAPESIDYSRPTIFLAGGITGCENWQTPCADKIISKSTLSVINPRRAVDFAIDDPDLALEQIQWEFHALDLADVRLFWFPEHGKCMITLFELGKELARGSKTYIGVHPNYIRRMDVIVQSTLEGRPDVYDDLDKMIDAIISRYPGRDS